MSEIKSPLQVRIPDGLRSQLKAAAKDGRRSMNSEIVARLELSTEHRTLRDEFAMAALTGLASACDEAGLWTANATSAAEWAYQHADAMLRARGGG